MATATKERPILFSGEMVRAILEGRKTRKKQYVSASGDPMSAEHLVRRLANGLDKAPEDGCWEWARSTTEDGYGRMTVDGRTVFAHRLAFELSGHEIGEGQHVLHRCDNPRCIRPDHLFAGTRSDNMRDCVSKGRHGGPPSPSFAELNPASKLTASEVSEIRSRLASGETQASLADMYGVSQSAIGKIHRRETWR